MPVLRKRPVFDLRGLRCTNPIRQADAGDVLRTSLSPTHEVILFLDSAKFWWYPILFFVPQRHMCVSDRSLVRFGGKSFCAGGRSVAWRARKEGTDRQQTRG